MAPLLSTRVIQAVIQSFQDVLPLLKKIWMIFLIVEDFRGSRSDGKLFDP